MINLPINWDDAPDDTTHAGVVEETGRVLFFKDIQLTSYRFYSHAREQWRTGVFKSPQVDYLVPRFGFVVERGTVVEQFIEDVDVPKAIAERAYKKGWRKVV